MDMDIPRMNIWIHEREYRRITKFYKIEQYISQQRALPDPSSQILLNIHLCLYTGCPTKHEVWRSFSIFQIILGTISKK